MGSGSGCEVVGAEAQCGCTVDPAFGERIHKSAHLSRTWSSAPRSVAVSAKSRPRRIGQQINASTCSLGDMAMFVASASPCALRGLAYHSAPRNAVSMPASDGSLIFRATPR